MADVPIRILLHHLQRCRPAPSGSGSDDGDLLTRFVRTRDEAAFELLVWRHGSMVYNVCRRVLRDSHAAEDAFQATFLVLVRKAGSIGKREALQGWLYRVASRIARRARARPIPVAETLLPEPAAASSDAHLWRDLRPVIDKEIARLPEKYRMPLILCYLSGLTTEAAAQQLGIPRGTVLSRLAWARQRLRDRLSLRGVTLSTALIATLMASDKASVSAALVNASIRAAISFAGLQPTAASAEAVILMKGLVRDMFMDRVKNGLYVILGLTVLGTAAALGAVRPATAKPVVGNGGEVARQTAAQPQQAKEVFKIPEGVRPIGTWERELRVAETNIHLILRFDANRATVTYEGPMPNGTAKDLVMTLQFEIDYSVTTDYVLYGVVTHIDSPKGGGKDAEAAAAAFSYVLRDHPFSVRYRLDENALTIKWVNLGIIGLEGGLTGKAEKDSEWQMMLGGTYQRRVPSNDTAH